MAEPTGFQPVDLRLRATYQTDVRAIAAALGIPVTPDQWVAVESGEQDGDPGELFGRVDIVIWERLQ